YGSSSRIWRAFLGNLDPGLVGGGAADGVEDGHVGDTVGEGGGPGVVGDRPALDESGERLVQPGVRREVDAEGVQLVVGADQEVGRRRVGRWQYEIVGRRHLALALGVGDGDGVEVDPDGPRTPGDASDE